MNANPETAPPDVGSRDGAPFTPDDRELIPDPAAVMSAALEWVEQNQTLAMLGAFALGVFIGAMMRD